MLISIIAIIVGTALLIGGIGLFVKEKDDADSAKIYGITAAVGVVVLVVGILGACGIIAF